jgi:hypothetical protein
LSLLHSKHSKLHYALNEEISYSHIPAQTGQ